MPGIPPKCLECGADLQYDPAIITYGCPICRAVAIKAPTTEEVRESRKEAV